jgi:hypothetical protein
MCIHRKLFSTGLVLTLLLWQAASCKVACAVEPAKLPKEPLLGFDGTLVNLPANLGLPGPGGPDDATATPSRGMRVDKVRKNTPAARLGLEPGDILIAIDLMHFTSFKGYHHALRCSGQRPLLLIFDKRSGKMVHRNVDLPHESLPEAERVPQSPDTYRMAVDLESDMKPDAKNGP